MACNKANIVNNVSMDYKINVCSPVDLWMDNKKLYKIKLYYNFVFLKIKNLSIVLISINDGKSSSIFDFSKKLK